MFSKTHIAFISRSTFFFLVLGVFALSPAYVSAEAPQVRVYDAEYISATGATLYGRVVPYGSVDTQRWFEWGESPAAPFSHSTTKTFNGASTEYFEEHISGLSPHTTYFFRAAAQNSNGTAYSGILNFETPANKGNPPVVTTQAASQVGGSQARVSCFLDTQGNINTQRWIEWGEDTGASQESTSREYQETNGTYAAFLSELSQGVAYYYRCAAKVSGIGTVYGDILSFRTSITAVNPPPPAPVYTGGGSQTTYQQTSSQSSLIVATKLASEIQNTSVRLNAVVLPGTASNVYGWFEWGGTPDLGFVSVKRYLGTGSYMLLSDMISGLTPGTTYFFKPVIESTQGRFEGALFSFRTTGTSPFPVFISTVNPQTQTGTVYTPQKPAVTSAWSKNGSTAIVSTEKSRITVEVTPSTNIVAQKERFYEMIAIENTSNVKIEDMAVRVILPNEAAYIKTGGSDFVENGKTLLYKIAEVKPKEKINLLFWLEAGPDIPDKTPIETIAVATWGSNIHMDDTQSVGRVVVVVDANRTAPPANSLVAAAVQGVTGNTPPSSGFFSEGLGTWCVIIGIVLLLFALYFLFAIMRRKDPDEDDKEPDMNQEDVKDPFMTDKKVVKTMEISPTIPIVPVKQFTTAKWAPPENLPV